MPEAAHRLGAAKPGNLLPGGGLGSRAKRIALVAAMGVVTLNIWTGAPLLGLWLGSKVAPASGISMLSFLVVAVVIGVAALLLLQLLGVLQAAHARASGRELPRRQTSWLKPMSGARTRGKGAVAPPSDRHGLRRDRGGRARRGRVRGLVPLLRRLVARLRRPQAGAPSPKPAA